MTKHRIEGFKTSEYRGRRLEGYLVVLDEKPGDVVVTKKYPVCFIHGLSRSRQLLSVGDDNGDALRGVGHAMEAARGIIDTVDQYGW